MVLKCLGTLGDEVGDDKEVHFLNRWIRCGVHQGSGAIFLEPERRHVDLLVQQLGVASAKGVETPDMKKSVDVQMMEANSSEGHGIHVSVVWYASSISESRQASSGSCCEENLSRKMVAPTGASLQDLKRLCRYLVAMQVFGQEA